MNHVQRMIVAGVAGFGLLAGMFIDGGGPHASPGLGVTVAHADTPTSATSSNVITVTGDGKAFGAPTVAYVSLGVQSQGATAQEALTANSAAMQAVIAKVQQQGVAAKDIQTSQVSIEPREDQRQPNSQLPPKIVGYVATNTVEVTVHAVTTVGALVDSVVGAGANQVNGIRFDVDDPAALQQQAMTLAVKSARARADTIAAAAGVTIAGVQSISMASASPIDRQAFPMAASAAPAPSTPVQPGQLSVTAQVTAVYRLQ